MVDVERIGEGEMRSEYGETVRVRGEGERKLSVRSVRALARTITKPDVASALLRDSC